MDNQNVILRVEDLSVDFRVNRKTTLHAVRDLSFEVRQGETLGILGESGCGKSVTCMSILRLLPEKTTAFPTGRILFQDKNLLTCSYRELKEIRGKDISMIFQEPMTSLNPLFTIGDQLMEIVRVHDPHIHKADAREAAMNAIEKVRIPNPERIFASYPFTLSGGMQQRVMIAMALLNKPKLLICDEPTTALDVTIQAQVLDLMNRLKEESGTSIIFVTHDLGVISEMADRVMVMYGGRKCEEGPMTEVFSQPLHPYTKGLIGSHPNQEETRSRLVTIPGSVPSLADMPKGCPFHNRCEAAMECCKQEFPKETVIHAEHKAFCYLCGEEESNG